MTRKDEIQTELRALDTERRTVNATFLERARVLRGELAELENPTPAPVLAPVESAITDAPGGDAAPDTIGFHRRTPRAPASDAVDGTLQSAEQPTNQPSETAIGEDSGVD